MTCCSFSRTVTYATFRVNRAVSVDASKSAFFGNSSARQRASRFVETTQKRTDTQCIHARQKIEIWSLMRPTEKRTQNIRGRHLTLEQCRRIEFDRMPMGNTDNYQARIRFPCRHYTGGKGGWPRDRSVHFTVITPGASRK